METAEKQGAVEAVSKQAIAVKAYEKLNRKSIDVEVPRNLSLIAEVEKYLEEAKKTSSSSDVVSDAERQLDELRKDVVSATLVPLRAVDILMVQGFVTETALQCRSQGFDFDVQLFTMSKAERAATIYLALRRRANTSERYFKSQEEVTILDDATLRELAKIYAESYVLTPEERKNS